MWQCGLPKVRRTEHVPIRFWGRDARHTHDYRMDPAIKQAHTGKMDICNDTVGRDRVIFYLKFFI